MSPIDLHTANHRRIDGQCKVYRINSIEDTFFILCISLLYVSGNPFNVVRSLTSDHRYGLFYHEPVRKRQDFSFEA